MCPVLAAMELGTLHIISHKASTHGSRTYQGLVRVPRCRMQQHGRTCATRPCTLPFSSPQRPWEHFVQVRDALGVFPAKVLAWTIFIYLFGSCTAFMMIAGDSFQALLHRTIPIRVEERLPLFVSSRWLSIVAPASAIILPLSLLPNMGALAPTSVMAVAAITFATASIVGKLFISIISRPEGAPILSPDEELINWDETALHAIPIMVFAYQCHVQSVPIYSEMTAFPRILPRWCCGKERTPTQRLASVEEKRKGMGWVFLTTYAECTVLYLCTGVAGYMLFGTHTESNILDNFSINDGLMLVVRILVGLAVALHYPINLHAARTALYDLVCEGCGRTPTHPAPYPALAAASLAIWAGSLLVACLVTDLGKLFQVVGGLAGSLIIFVMPGLLLAVDNNAPQSGVVPEAEELNSDAVLHGEAGRADNVVEPQDHDQMPLLHDGEAVKTAPADESLLELGGSGDVQQQHGEEPVLGRFSQHGQTAEPAQGNCTGKSSPQIVVAGWGLVVVGLCIMCLTVHLTFE